MFYHVFVVFFISNTNDHIHDVGWNVPSQITNRKVGVVKDSVLSLAWSNENSSVNEYSDNIRLNRLCRMVNSLSKNKFSTLMVSNWYFNDTISHRKQRYLEFPIKCDAIRSILVKDFHALKRVYFGRRRVYKELDQIFHINSLYACLEPCQITAQRFLFSMPHFLWNNTIFWFNLI